MDQIYIALQKFLANHHVTSELDHDSSGERNLRVSENTTLAVFTEIYNENTGEQLEEVIEGENTTLAVFIEIYNEDTGEHECVPITDLLDKLVGEKQ